jgi:hypothetical protein
MVHDQPVFRWRGFAQLLSALSPDVVNYYNFNLPPVQGALLIFASSWAVL